MKSLNITEFIRIVAIALVLLWVFLLVKPFIGILAWGIILAIALFPIFKRFSMLFGERHKKKMTAVFSLVFISLLIVPTYMLVSSVVTRATTTMNRIGNNTLEIAPPSASVKEWPILGERLYDNWSSFSENSGQYLLDHQGFFVQKSVEGIQIFTGIIGSVLAFLLSLIIAIMFMANAASAYEGSLGFVNKLYGKKEGTAVLLMARDTVRNVVKGILFVAILQALLCYSGFVYVDMPAASIFAFLVLLAAIIGLPVTIVIIPTIFIAFSITDDTLTATLFSIYIFIVSLLDNFLKPILLAKGLKTPMVLILIGAIGGMLLHGIIGLFVGTVLMAVIHRLYLSWLSETDSPSITMNNDFT